MFPWKYSASLGILNISNYFGNIDLSFLFVSLSAIIFQAHRFNLRSAQRGKCWYKKKGQRPEKYHIAPIGLCRHFCSPVLSLVFIGLRGVAFTLAKCRLSTTLDERISELSRTCHSLSSGRNWEGSIIILAK